MNVIKKASIIILLMVLYITFWGCDIFDNQNPGTDLPDWETFQGNSSHTAYVPVTLNPNKFHEIWSWDRPNSEDGVTLYINDAIVADGVVYITEDDYHSSQTLYALREIDGSIVWSYSFGVVSHLNPPAVSNGIVSVSTSGHEDSFLWNFEASKGELISKTPFNSQWPQYLSPTLYDQTAYLNTGYYGGRISAFSTNDGTLLWESEEYGDNDMFTPAVDDSAVYQYSGNGLNVLQRSDGHLLMSIDDPDPDETGYSYIGSTILGTMNDVICFSGDNFSGQASSSTEGYDARRLVSFDLSTESIAWKSTSRYLTHPAVARGEIFAGSNSPVRLEALKESDGTVLWTWTPQDPLVTSFHRNVIATDNLIFISSDVAVHAISRKTHQEVWTYPEPGALSLSSGKILYISVGYRESEGRLVAISLEDQSEASIPSLSSEVCWRIR